MYSDGDEHSNCNKKNFHINTGNLPDSMGILHLFRLFKRNKKHHTSFFMTKQKEKL